MSIEFAEITDDLVYLGSLRAVLPFPNAFFAPAYAAGLRAVLPSGHITAEFIGQTSEEVPQFMGFEALISPGIIGQFEGFYTATGTLDLTLPRMRASFYTGARFLAELPPINGRFTNALPAFISTPLSVSIQLAAQFEAPRITDTMLVTVDVRSALTVVLEAVMNFTDSTSVIAKLRATIESSFIAQDMFQVVLQRTLLSTAVIDSENTAVLRMVHLLADQLTISDETVGFYNALVTIASAMVLGDQVVPGRDGQLLDEFVITDDMVSKINALVEMVAELIMEDTVEAGLLLFALVDDEFSLGEEMLPTVAMLAEILDNATLGFRITTEAGDTFVGYSINTRTAAASEYENYPFSSMAVIGGIPYGTGPDGIYRLTGDTDNAAPIHASVYTGLTDFGSSYLKQLPAAWIGLTSTGEMVLKVVTTDKGRKKENWYRMKARPHGAPVDSRFSPAKGLEGRYWGFKIENLDGADFQLDSLKLWPLAMKRRYSGR